MRLFVFNGINFLLIRDGSECVNDRIYLNNNLKVKGERRGFVRENIQIRTKTGYALLLASEMLLVCIPDVPTRVASTTARLAMCWSVADDGTRCPANAGVNGGGDGVDEGTC